MTHAHKGLTAPDGTPSGALYGTVRALRAFLMEYPCAGIFFARDRGIPAFRIELTEKTSGIGYKSGRVHDPEDDFYRQYKYQIKNSLKLLPHLGIHVVEAKGYEADDVIGALANWLTKAGRKVYVYSGDKDMVQLAALRGASVFRPHSDEMIDSCDPHFIVQRAMEGDSSDTIPGVPGVGPKRAAQIIADVYEAAGGTLGWDGEDLTDFLDALDPEDKQHRKVIDHAEVLAANVQVMDLHFTRKRSLAATKIVFGRVDRGRFERVCRKKRYREFLSRLQFYLKPFEKMWGREQWAARSAES